MTGFEAPTQSETRPFRGWVVVIAFGGKILLWLGAQKKSFGGIEDIFKAISTIHLHITIFENQPRVHQSL